MMEIYFRGKRIGNGNWAHGYYFYKNDISLPALPGLSNAYILWNNGSGDVLWVEVDPATVGQCTGLTDKNGNKIFEGDILLAKYKFDGDSYKFIAKFGECGGEKNVLHDVGFLGFYFDAIGEKAKYNLRKDILYWVDSENYECEVIGNVYDNPWLLEGGDMIAE